MAIELTQRDLKEARESMKAVSREKCRDFLDAFYHCTKENSLAIWNCRKQLIDANDCVKKYDSEELLLKVQADIIKSKARLEPN